MLPRTPAYGLRSRIAALWSTTAIVAVCAVTCQASAAVPYVDVSRQVLPRIVKIYGAGGIRGLEAYQSGILISSEGHILTAWSYVLDTDSVLAVLDDGRRFPASLVGADPRSELAVLKIDAADLPYFDLRKALSCIPAIVCWPSVTCTVLRRETSRPACCTDMSRRSPSSRLGAACIPSATTARSMSWTP